MAAQPATISAYVKKLSKTNLVGLGGVNPPQGLAADQRQGGVNPGRRKTGHRTRRHGGLTPPTPHGAAEFHETRKKSYNRRPGDQKKNVRSLVLVHATALPATAAGAASAIPAET